MKDLRIKKLDEILAFFNRKSIDVMLIKGAALDILVYEHSASPISGDIDIILRLRREEVSSKERREIWQFLRTIPWLESDFYYHHDVNMNNILPVDFNNIWHNATKIKFNGRDAFLMSPEDTLISVCISSCRKKFFRLKAMCDIAELINKFSDIKWHEIIRDATTYRCNHIVYTAILVTEMMLGCQVPDNMLNNLITRPVKAKFIRYLAQHRSFSSLSSLFSGKKIFGQKVGRSLILPYATYSWQQALAHLRQSITAED
jgi:hypothetical protein